MGRAPCDTEARVPALIFYESKVLMFRVFATALFALTLVVPAYAQDPVPTPEGEVAAAAPAGADDAQAPRPTGLTIPRDSATARGIAIRRRQSAEALGR
jgi:hypothetical protein